MMTNEFNRKSKISGFTLMELLVVVLIIGLLTGIVAPRLLGQVSKSEVTAARAQLDALEKAIQAYRLDVGHYPTTSEGLKVLLIPVSADPRWRGPYLRSEIPLDPWGTPYGYQSPGRDGREFELSSLGRDKAPGGVADDADLVR
ncbi:MAG TPA: type II secretion system major pseudopilin GspG [Ideonella sp.]|uniref:type II secretion system major pseudopilin GspG n=1 Tax=Ideonella sp. TaxID=1929293 RepID=UPI002D0187E4|nr:type II secretion system major pseudopilin GspG [Ideonella sp.]HSI48010.1 type II secretion system major pseudopilin GspG [Ideonella sp.]